MEAKNNYDFLPDRPKHKKNKIIPTVDINQNYRSEQKNKQKKLPKNKQ